MGGCSSKPQTAECSNEGLLDHPSPLNLLFHTSDSSPPHGSQHTLKSLFNQHGRDGEDLLGNAQTLHELLLHAVDSIELPDSENQSTVNTEANLQISSPCKQNSPVSVLSNAAENNASTCIKIEDSLPNLAEANEETGAQLVQVTEENAEKCTKSEGFTSNSAEGNQEKGAASLEGFLEDEKSGKFEVMLPALPEEDAQECIKAEGFLSNVAEENPEISGKLEGFVPNLAELGVLVEENASKVESASSPEIEGSNASACAQTRGPNQGPKSDLLKTSEPNLLESPTTDVLQKFKASDAMESTEPEMQGLTAIAMKDEIKRDVQDAIPMEAQKTPKQDVKCEKNEKKALQDKETEEHIVKAVEGDETEKAVGGKNTEMQPEKALEIEKDEISQGREKAEVQNEKAMEGEVQFVSGGISSVQGKKAMEDDMLQATTEKAMECEKVHMQDEKELEGRKTGVQDEKSMGEDEKTGVQNKRVFDGVVEKMQRAREDEKAVCVEKPESMQEAEKKELQDEKKTIVQDEKKRVQREEAGEQDQETGEQDQETGVHHEEDEKPLANVSPLHVTAEDEEIMANVSAVHVNAEDEEAIADVPSSHLNQSFAHTLEKHTIVDSCFEALAGSEQSIVIGSGPILELASKENTVDAVELGLTAKLNESDQKKRAFKDNTIDVVADLGLTEKLEADLKKLASDGNTIEAAGLADIEKMEFEQKKNIKTEHIEKIESHESSVEAVAGGGHTKLCNIFRALDDEQSKSTDSEQMLHIERHGKLEMKAPEALVEQSLHVGNVREESSNIECPSQLVVENDTSHVNVKVEMSSEARIISQKDHDAEKLQCGHIQMPISELHVITSKGVESHMQARNDSALCSTPESSVHENLPCPTVVEDDEKRVVDINSSSLSAAEKGSIECVESKPRQTTSGEGIDDANGNSHMEVSKQCDEKGL